MNCQELARMGNQLRRDIIEMIYRSKDGHPAPSLSCADIVACLYFGVMNVDPKDPHWEDRDRFVLSKGHACPALYAALGQKGYFSRDLYPALRHIDSILQGHPDMKKTPGVDMTSGSLGNGLAAATGMALAAKLQGKSYKTYVLTGDGELGEGINWEAAQTAAKYKLDNLTLIVDNNGMQSGGSVENVGGVINIPGKFAAFGFEVKEIDGHDVKQIMDALTSLHPGKPLCVVAHTVKGKGVSYMEHNNAWHKGTPNDEQYRTAVNELEAMING
ncbi:MAG: transketolase [Clostridiales bacterium]|nr:transketolase [Clostridiales bacterium]